jgi:hypothetical protein
MTVAINRKIFADGSRTALDGPISGSTKRLISTSPAWSAGSFTIIPSRNGPVADKILALPLPQRIAIFDTVDRFWLGEADQGSVTRRPSNRLASYSRQAPMIGLAPSRPGAAERRVDSGVQRD